MGTNTIFSAACEGEFGGTVGVQGTARTVCRTHFDFFARLFLQVIDSSINFTERIKFSGQSDHPLGAFENNLLYVLVLFRHLNVSCLLDVKVKPPL